MIRAIALSAAVLAATTIAGCRTTVDAPPGTPVTISTPGAGPVTVIGGTTTTSTAP